MQTITPQEPIQPTQQWESLENYTPVQTQEEVPVAAHQHATSLAQKAKKNPRRRIDRIRKIVRIICDFPFFVWMGPAIVHLIQQPTFNGWLRFFGILLAFRVACTSLSLILSPLVEGILTLTIDRWDKYKIKKAFHLTLLFVGTIFPVMALFGWFHVLWLRQNPSSLARCVEMVAFIATAGLTPGPLLKWLNHKEKKYDSTHS